MIEKSTEWIQFKYVKLRNFNDRKYLKQPTVETWNNISESSKHTIDPRPEKKSAQREFCHSVCGQSVEQYSTALLPCLPSSNDSNYFESNDILWHFFRIHLLLLEVNSRSRFCRVWLRCNPLRQRSENVFACCRTIKIADVWSTYGKKKRNSIELWNWIKCVAFAGRISDVQDVMSNSLIATLAISCPWNFGAISGLLLNINSSTLLARAQLPTWMQFLCIKCSDLMQQWHKYLAILNNNFLLFKSQCLAIMRFQCWMETIAEWQQKSFRKFSFCEMLER